MSKFHPSSSIPELIKFIKHSFRESEFDEVQKALMNREKMMQVKIENLVGDCASLKKQIDYLENLQSFTVLEKCNAEEKLGKSEKRCEELVKESAGMGETIRKLRCEKLGFEEKLESSGRKYEEMEKRLAKMEEKLWRSERRCEGLNKESVEMGETIRKLRCEKLGFLEKLKSSERKCEEMEERLAKREKEMEEKLGRSERRCEELNKEGLEMGETIRMLRCEKLGVEEKLESSERQCKEMEELRRDANEVVEIGGSKLKNQSMSGELRLKRKVGDEGVILISDSDGETEKRRDDSAIHHRSAKRKKRRVEGARSSHANEKEEITITVDLES